MHRNIDRPITQNGVRVNMHMTWLDNRWASVHNARQFKQTNDDLSDLSA